jgi:RimJ/RimL family protein N-acetyltransferase
MSSAECRLQLREVEEADLAVFFEHQRDPIANQMAAFPPRDRATFMTHWNEKVLGDGAVIKKTIVSGEWVAGYIVCFERCGRRLVGYWIGREFWGEGIATKALKEFLISVTARPLHALVAKRNAGSIRVLEKCGFALSREDAPPALPSGSAVEELVYELTEGSGPCESENCAV